MNTIKIMLVQMKTDKNAKKEAHLMCTIMLLSFEFSVNIHGDYNYLFTRYCTY
jgi:hypothetical protein